MDRRGGFTLIETLVALAVLGIGLLALAKMTLTTVQANTYSEQYTQATVLAQAKMEQLRSYAASERTDRYSVFDFDYLVSQATGFTSIKDPPTGTTLVTIDGLLSGGNGGAAVTSSGGTVFEVLNDTGANGDLTAGDGIFSASDEITVSAHLLAPGATGFVVNRRWTVDPLEPLPLAPNFPRVDFARVQVDAWWTDRQGTVRSTRLESIVHRRQ